MVIRNQASPLPADSALQLRYHYVEFLTEHLSDCCRAFEGDLQEMLVLAVLGQVYMRAHLDAQSDGSLARRAVPAPLGINASRIADITGIPRQTVRRKLAKLESRGWVEALASGFWGLVLRDGVAAAREGESGIDALDARSLARVVDMADQVNRIIARTKPSS